MTAFTDNVKRSAHFDCHRAVFGAGSGLLFEMSATRREPVAGKQVTIVDVARRAGVSKSTVSKHLTARPYVSEAAKTRIARAIQELGYRPNRMAQGLAAGRSGLVGVLVPSIANPYQADLVAGIDREATACGNSILLASADRERAREHRVLDGLVRSGVDGLIVTSAYVGDTELARLHAAGVPIVLAGRHVSDVEVDYVVVDSRQGARLAVEHLAELGHRSIAHVAGPSTILEFRDRRRSYQDTLRRRGLPQDKRLVVSGQPTPQLGREAVERLLALPSADRPTALFAAADWVALGAMGAAQGAGLAVPGDLSIVGFDNISFCEVLGTPLTTVDGQPQEIGRRAMQMLQRRLGGNLTDADPQREILAAELVVRGSTALVNAP